MSNRVIVSVDVEDWYHGPTVISPKVPSKTLESFLANAADAERAYRYIGSCLDLLAAHDIKATFFWVAEYARRFEGLIGEVVAVMISILGGNTTAGDDAACARGSRHIC